MKNTIITELVKFKVEESKTEEQLLSMADIFINGFQKKQDGFIDVELVKEEGKNEWCFIFHFKSMEKVKAIGEKMRNSKEFDSFKTILAPGSMNVTFHSSVRKW